MRAHLQGHGCPIERTIGANSRLTRLGPTPFLYVRLANTRYSPGQSCIGDTRSCHGQPTAAILNSPPLPVP